jgi:hypothetical protein
MSYLFTNEVQAVLLGAVVIAFGLGWLSRRRPDLGWLAPFPLPELTLSEEQRRRRRRTANRIGGLEFIALGLALPLVYVAATVMTFSGFDPVETAIAVVASVGCVGVGAWILWKNR